MITIINAVNLLGDSLYSLTPIKEYIKVHGSTDAFGITNLLLVADRGLAFQMFQEVFPYEVLFDDIDAAIRAYSHIYDVRQDMRIIPLSAGTSGEICFKHMQNTNQQMHISEGYAQMLGVTIPSINPPEFHVDEEELDAFKDHDQNIIRIGISPFSRSCSRHSGQLPNKTLDDWKWMHLINYLRPHCTEFSVIGGPKDRLVNVAVSQEEYFAASSWDELKFKLKSLDMFVTVDNGLGHIASALGVPTIILWPVVSSIEFIAPLWAPTTRYIKLEPNQASPSAILHPLRIYTKDFLGGSDDK